jgi:hypothetical protein
MKNYHYELREEENSMFFWFVIENQTNQVMAEFFFEDDAIKMTNQLLEGYGFDGYTPSFFLQ